MRVSKNKLTAELEKESIQELLHGMDKVHSLKDVRLFLNAFLTDDEQETILRRMAAGRLLKSGRKYREIVDLLEISHATISNVRDMLDGRGYGRNPDRQRVYSVLLNYEKEKKIRSRGLRYKGVR